MMYWINLTIAVMWGTFGDFLLSALIRLTNEKVFDQPVANASITALGIVVFIVFASVGLLVSEAIAVLTLKRIYYEHTIKFQKAYPQGKIATANFEGAEDL